MKLMKLIRCLTVNLLNILLVPDLLFKLYNIKTKLIHKDYIFIQDRGGFGHSFIFQDMIRMSYDKKKIIYLQFFENKRHNKYLPILFGIDFFYFKYKFEIRFLNKKIRFGKTENNYDFIIEYLLKIYLRIFHPNTKIIFIKDFYKKIYDQFGNYTNNYLPPFSNKEFLKLKISKSIITNQYYYNLLKKNSPKLEKEYFIIKYENYIKKHFNNNNFQFLFYIRSKGTHAKEDLLRNGSQAEVYLNIFNFLKQHGYKINLIGDWENIFSDDLIISKGIQTYKNCNLSRDLFDILALTNCYLFVGEHGGAQFFANYIKKSIIINGFPYGQKLNDIPIYYKNLVPKNLDQKFIDLKKIYLQYDIVNDYDIQSLDSNMIINYIKKNLIND